MKPNRQRNPRAGRGPYHLDTTARDLTYAWVLGVGVAVAIAVYGLVCICTRSARLALAALALVNLRISPMLTERPTAYAVALGIMWVALAGFLHAHFFWAWREKYYGYAQIGRSVCAIVAGGAIVYAIYLITAW